MRHLLSALTASVLLEPGEQKVVTFAVNVSSELRVLGRDFKWEAPEGVFKVMIGGSQAASVNAQFTVEEA